jgi:hypothetical protein
MSRLLPRAFKHSQRPFEAKKDPGKTGVCFREGTVILNPALPADISAWTPD